MASTAPANGTASIARSRVRSSSSITGRDHNRPNGCSPSTRANACRCSVNRYQPELADVLSTIIGRIRGDARRRPAGAPPTTTTNASGNPPMPLLFQRRLGGEHRAACADGAVRTYSTTRSPTPASQTETGGPLRFTPHDFRRMFITDAIMHGMPPHIAQLVAGHRDINITMGYKAVYPEEVIHGPPGVHRPPPRTAPQRGIPHPHRRGMGRVPRPLRTPQGLHRHLRPRLRHPLHP